MSDELDKKLVEDIGVRYARMIEHSVGVMAVVDRTYTLMRDAKGNLIKHADMSEEDWNIAQDAFKPPKQVPFYLRCHHNRVELAHRIAGDRAAAPQQIAKYVVRALEKAPREYPVIDVQVKEK